MSETKMYYLGIGEKFIKAQCKPYKTIEGALKAAAKDESFVVWDEDGNVIGSLTDNVPEGALKTNPDGSVNAYDASGKKVGEVDAKTVEALTGNKSGEGQQVASTGDGAEGGQNGKNEGKPENESPADGKAENEAHSAQDKASTGDGAEGGQNDKDAGVEKGIRNEQIEKFSVVVVCNGSLRLRRAASWEDWSECGRASKGQTYIGKRLFMLDGLPMLETIDGLFMSAAAEHVKIDKM